ncbi:hypothetical protein B7760_01760 [Burkholderia glumae]|uniref:hypothetical protein n=1 Tax=Burkholderia glumae TaxID=337 RepID=UPI00157B43DE|nr:hypothetical protein [Burkholderia glumae]QKM47736.1 hypothetical protein B7760_01760 [Burkholderia glumae]QTP33501.1 hypothetical protein B7759_02095 [Burkholderia glumae]
MKRNPLARNLRPRIKWSAFNRDDGKLKRRRRSPFYERRLDRLFDTQMRAAWAQEYRD